MKCPECRSDIPEGSLRCMYCGYSIGESSGFRPRVVGEFGDESFKYTERKNSQKYDEKMYTDYSNQYNYSGAEPQTDFYGYPNYYQRQQVTVSKSAKETNDRMVIYLLAALLATNILNVLLIAAILILL